MMRVHTAYKLYLVIDCFEYVMMKALYGKGFDEHTRVDVIKIRYKKLPATAEVSLL